MDHNFFKVRYIITINNKFHEPMLKEKTSNFAYHLQNLENKKQKVFFFFKLPSIKNRLVQGDLFFLKVGFKSV